MTYLLALLLTVPPVPPPPADRLAAASELLRTAPVPPYLHAQMRDRSAAGYAYDIVEGGKADGDAMRAMVRKLVSDQLAGSARFVADVDGCMTDEIGWTYDLPTLQDIARVVTTPGGRVLWNASLPGVVEKCYGSTVSNFLQYTGYASALRWLVQARPKAALPRYDAAGGDLHQLGEALVRVCGPSTRDALTERGDRLGVAAGWAGKKGRDAALACLIQTATLAGYDLAIIGADGSTTKMIFSR